MIKISAQYAKAERRKGHYSYRNWWELSALELNMKYNKAKSYVICQLNMSKNAREKVRNTVYFQYSKVQKGNNSYENWRKFTTLKLDM